MKVGISHQILDAYLYLYSTAVVIPPMEIDPARHFAMAQAIHMPHININITQKYFLFYLHIDKKSIHNHCSFALQ